MVGRVSRLWFVVAATMVGVRLMGCLVATLLVRITVRLGGLFVAMVLVATLMVISGVRVS